MSRFQGLVRRRYEGQLIGGRGIAGRVGMGRVTQQETHTRAFSMSKLRIHIFSISLDGYGAGPDQGVKDPLGRNGESLHDWVVPTRTFKGPRAKSAGTIGVDDAVTHQANDNIGAWILGRNMFGPVRGPWPDESWK